MIDRDLLTECEQLAAKIAPEITCPIYCMVQPDTFRPAACDAYTVTNGDNPLLRQSLVASGRWRGPGMLVVFVNADFRRDEAIEIFLHELTHQLARQSPVSSIDTDHEPSQQEYAEAYKAMDDWRADFDAPIVMPLWCPEHDRIFHRIFFHVWWRAALEGYVVGFDACAGPRYDLSAPYIYFLAIGNEPVLMRHKQFKDILAEPEPPKFTALWRHDLAYWMKSNPEKVKEFRCQQD